MSGERVSILDHGYIEFVEAWGSDERIVEAARMSTQQGFKGWGTEDAPGDEKLLAYLWKNQHTSPFEMAGAIFEVRAPIFVFREWHRHRTQSFNEASARYAPLPDVNYLPTLERVTGQGSTANKQAQGIAPVDPVAAKMWLAHVELLYERAEAVYRAGLAAGVPKELARVVMPVGRYSTMRASANLLNWIKFLRLRCDPAAQWEIRQYANAVCEMLATRFPRTIALARSW